MRALGTIIMLSLVLSLGLSGCGRKNPPKPPASFQPATSDQS